MKNLFVPVVFVSALFLSSLIMFVMEPMVAKILLPGLGGAAGVWTACVLYYQVLLLCGYLYAHLVSDRLKRRNQLIVHAFVLLIPFLFLPVRAPFIEPSVDHPVFFLILALSIMVGAVFFAISTTAPLLQKWYSTSAAPGNADPYFLYAASNAGGLIGLIAYPFFLESAFSLQQQTWIFSVSYILLVALISLCALMGGKQAIEKEVLTRLETAEEGLPIGRELRWIFLAFLPSSLFLGLTTYVTTELSGVPFFWVVPLFIYLLSFVIAFARPQKWLLTALGIGAPILLIVVLAFMAFQSLQGLTTGTPRLVTDAISLHLLALFIVSTACHGLLARDRPAPVHLTRYFLLVGTGGAFGSLFNTLLAPLVFHDWYEYPLVLVLCLLVLLPTNLASSRISKRLAPGILTLVLSGSWLLDALLKSNAPYLLQRFPELFVGLESGLLFLIPLLFCLMLPFSLLQRRVTVSIVSLCFFAHLSMLGSDVVLRTRNFYGCLSIEVMKAPAVCKFWHGATLHGMERLDPELRGLPGTYFHPTGPIGKLLISVYGKPAFITDQGKQVLEISESVDSAIEKKLEPYAVLGLGCGTLAAYASQGQTVVFYELDRSVIDVADNPFYFTYLFQARKRGVDLKLVEGDGRLQIGKAPYDFFKVIIVDAFNSDSIPTHLLTKEALEIYLRKLKADGLIAFQITNNYYDLKPVLARLARELDLRALFLTDFAGSGDFERYPTDWVVLTRKSTQVESLLEKGFQPLAETDGVELWTDDYCSVLKALIAPFS